MNTVLSRWSDTVPICWWGTLPCLSKPTVFSAAGPLVFDVWYRDPLSNYARHENTHTSHPWHRGEVLLLLWKAACSLWVSSRSQCRPVSPATVWETKCYASINCLRPLCTAVIRGRTKAHVDGMGMGTARYWQDKDLLCYQETMSPTPF